jgi:hypothetical protein
MPILVLIDRGTFVWQGVENGVFISSANVPIINAELSANALARDSSVHYVRDTDGACERRRRIIPNKAMAAENVFVRIH